MFKACAPPAVAARFDIWPSLQGSTFHAADKPEMSSDDAVRTKSAGLLSNQGEKSINFYFIRVSLRKKYKLVFHKGFFKKKSIKVRHSKAESLKVTGLQGSFSRAPGCDGASAGRKNVNVGT